jgi:hypothetical protein
MEFLDIWTLYTNPDNSLRRIRSLSCRAGVNAPAVHFTMFPHPLGRPEGVVDTIVLGCSLAEAGDGHYFQAAGVKGRCWCGGKGFRCAWKDRAEISVLTQLRSGGCNRGSHGPAQRGALPARSESCIGAMQVIPAEVIEVPPFPEHLPVSPALAPHARRHRPPRYIRR